MNSTTVIGQKYLAAPQDIHALDGKLWMVFFPSLGLNIDQNGTVSKTDGHFKTAARQDAERAFELSNRDSRRALREQKLKAGEEADRGAITEVPYSKETVERIQALYTQSLAIKNELTGISQQILEMPKPAPQDES